MLLIQYLLMAKYDISYNLLKKENELLIKHIEDGQKKDDAITDEITRNDASVFNISGKTHFITNLLKELDYDIIQYDAGDVRNKSLIDTLYTMSIIIDYLEVSSIYQEKYGSKTQ